MSTTKGPHTHVWITLARAVYNTEAQQKIANAPKRVLEAMLEQMTGEGPSPVWDGMVRDFGNPLKRYDSARL